MVKYPSYLDQPNFEYRHVKIKIMLNEDKEGGAAEAAVKLIEKSKKFFGDSTDIAIKTLDGLGGSATDMLNNVNKNISEMEKNMRAGTRMIECIVLPLPNSLNDSASHEWSVDTGIAKSIIESLSSTSLGSIGKKSLALTADMANVRKPLADPGYFQNYAGTQPREWSMSWELMPSNKDDAQTIWQIVHLLKKYSSPTTAVNHAIILAPHYFQLEFNNPYIDTMMMAKDVVIKSIGVNYTADGNAQQHADGMPKKMTLDITFAERSMMTNEMYG